MKKLVLLSTLIFGMLPAMAGLYAEKRPVAVIDLHNPYISGKGNEAVECPMLNPEIVQDLVSVRFLQRRRARTRRLD